MATIDEIRSELLKKYSENGEMRRMSPSSLKAFKESPKKLLEYWAKKDEKSTVAQSIGKVFEMLYFESENFAKKVAVFDKSGCPHPESTFNNKANKEWKLSFEAKNADKIIIEKAALAPIEKAAQIARKRLTLGENGYDYQYQLTVTGIIHGIEFLGILDALVETPKNGQIVFDTKSKSDGGISDGEIRYYCQKFNVYLQMEIYRQLTGAAKAFILVGDTKNGDARFFDLSFRMLETAQELELLCKKLKEWYFFHDCAPLEYSEFFTSEHERENGFSVL